SSNPGLDSFAYAFNAIKWSNSSSTPYLAIFDAETWNCSGRTIGDSMGARYGTVYDFGSHERGQDLIIGRSIDDEWNCSDDAAPTTHLMKDGASNAQMLLNASGTTWASYWLVVLHDSQIPSGKRLHDEDQW